MARSTLGNENRILFSCAISYVVVSILKFWTCFQNIYAEVIVATAICIVFAVIGVKVFQSKRIKNFLVDHFSYSPSKTAWEDSFDYELGSRIRVKFKGSEQTIVGNLASMGDIPTDPWIALSYFSIFEKLDDTEPMYSRKTGAHFMMVNLNDIEFAEIWTNEGDKEI